MAKWATMTATMRRTTFGRGMPAGDLDGEIVAGLGAQPCPARVDQEPAGLRSKPPTSRRLRAGNDATVAGDPTSAAPRKADPGVGARGGWPKLEKDNPQEPRPGGERANPPAPGRLGPWGSSAPRGTPVAFPSLARESLVLRPEGRLNLTAATAGGATHRPAVRRPDPSALLAGTPTRISRSNRVGPSGQLFTMGPHGVAVKATFRLARRICAAQAGWNYLNGISGAEARLAPTMPLSEEEPMVDRADPTGGALGLARSVTLATARRRTAVARPAGEVAGLLLVESSCVARGRGRPRSTWHDRWRVGSPVGARPPQRTPR